MDIDEITEGLRKLQIENTEIKKLINNKKPVYNNNNRTQKFEPRKNNYNNYNNRSKDNNTCFTCGRPGHYARDCYQNQPRRDNNSSNEQTNNRRSENRRPDDRRHERKVNYYNSCDSHCHHLND